MGKDEKVGRRQRKGGGLTKGHLRNVAYNLYELANEGIPAMFPSFCFFFMIFGIIGGDWSKGLFRKQIYLAWMFILSVLIVIIFHVELRYLAPSVIIGCIWMGKGIKDGCDFCGKGFRSSFVKKGAIIICAVIIMGSLIPSIFKTHFREKGEPVEEKEAGLWLKENRPNSVIMSRKPQISFYAEGRYVVLPFAPYNDIFGFAKEKGVNILVVDERYIPGTRPELVGLLNEREIPEGLELIYKNDEIEGSKILLYEIQSNGQK